MHLSHGMRATCNVCLDEMATGLASDGARCPGKPKRLFPCESVRNISLFSGI